MKPDFKKILTSYTHGTLLGEPQLIASGLTNQLYHIHTTKGEFALKIMRGSSARVRTKKTYECIESHVESLQSAGVSTVVAEKNQHAEFITQFENSFYCLYPWITATTCYFPVDMVLPHHAYSAGKLLAQIHLRQEHASSLAPDLKMNFDTDAETFEGLLEAGRAQSVTWIEQVSAKATMLKAFNIQCHDAHARLGQHVCFSHGDFMPHNMMWPYAEKPSNTPILIDWELAGWINPGAELVLALISFSQFPNAGQFNSSTLSYFMQAYYDAGAELNDSISDAIYVALNKGWLNWMIFNMQRSLSTESIDERQSASQIVVAVLAALESILQRLPELEALITQIRAQNVQKKALLRDQQSLTHVQGDFVSAEEIVPKIEMIKARLKARGDADTLDKLLPLLDKLSEFELGRFFIKNQGALSGYWTYYIISGFSDSELHPLERTILSQAPSILATRQRFHIFQQLLQQHIRNHAVVCSVPCGSMTDLLTLDVPEGVSELRWVGVDWDEVSLDLARSLAMFYKNPYRCNFFKEDAWRIHQQHPEEFDIITTNGLNIYQSDDEKVVELYAALLQALKPGGKLIGSSLSDPKTEWDMTEINPESLALQRAIFVEILQATWSNFRSSALTKTQLVQAGFQSDSIEIVWDKAHMFYSFVAQKSLTL